MKTIVWPAFAVTVFLSACAADSPQPAAADSASANPFYGRSTLPFQYPPFDKIKNEHYRPAFEKGMADQVAEIQAIAGNPAPATFENTIVAMERSGQVLSRVNTVFGALTSAHTND